MTKPEEEQASIDTAAVNETDNARAGGYDAKDAADGGAETASAGAAKNRKRVKSDAAKTKKTGDTTEAKQARKKTPEKEEEKKEEKIEEKIEAKEQAKKEEKEEGELIVRFSIEVSKEEIEKKFEEMAAKYAAEIKLPGFRVGKVPIEVVKNRFKEAINEEVKKEVIEHAVADRIKKDNIKPASNPSIEKLDHNEGENLTADVKVEIYPEILLPDLETIEITVPAKDIRLEEYDEEKNIDAFLEANRRSLPVSNRAIKEKDYIKFKFQSKMLDTKRMTPRKDSVYLVSKEAPTEILDLYSELIGKNREDKITVKRKYPADYSKKIWAGKEIEHYIEIVDIFELVKPNLDKEFLQSQGFADENTFREQLKEDYARYEKNYRENKIDHLISDRIIDIVRFPVPKALVEEEAVSMMVQSGREAEIKNANELKDLLPSFMVEAEKKLRFSLILSAVREKFKLEISADELESEYGKIAERNHLAVKEVRKYYLNSKQEMQRLKDFLLVVKTTNFLKEKIKIKEV